MYYIILTLFIMYTIVYINDTIIARPSHCPVLTTYSMQMNRQWEGPQAGSSGSGAFCFQEGAWEWTQVWWWDVVKSTVLWTTSNSQGRSLTNYYATPGIICCGIHDFPSTDHVEDSCRNEHAWTTRRRWRTKLLHSSSKFCFSFSPSYLREVSRWRHWPSSLLFSDEDCSSSSRWWTSTDFRHR